MERSKLRELIVTILLNDSDLTAFCSDYFNDIYRRFSDGMDRVQKVTLLLDYGDPSIIIDRLREINPNRVSQYEKTIDPLGGYIGHVSDAAIRIITERPRYWEYRLFSKVLSDELGRSYLKKKDSDLEITFEQTVVIGHSDYPTWAAAHFLSMERFANNLSKIFNIALKEALGEPGQSGNPDAIVYSAKRISDGYNAAIEWGLEWKRRDPPEMLRKLADIAAKYGKGIVVGIEDFDKKLRSELARIDLNNEKEEIHITMKISFLEDTMKEFYIELHNIYGLLGIDYQSS